MNTPTIVTYDTPPFWNDVDFGEKTTSGEAGREGMREREIEIEIEIERERERGRERLNTRKDNIMCVCLRDMGVMRVL